MSQVLICLLTLLLSWSSPAVEGNGGFWQSSIAAKTTATLPEGSFSIANWSGYPANLAKPTGPFRLLEGAEYDAASSLLNNVPFAA